MMLFQENLKAMILLSKEKKKFIKSLKHPPLEYPDVNSLKKIEIKTINIDEKFYK